MHTIVAIKQVPDTTNVWIDPETGTSIREGVPAVINFYDRHALEMAVRLKERFGRTATELIMGPPKDVESHIECVERGADRANLLSDRRFGGADTLVTSYVIARAIEAGLPYDRFPRQHTALYRHPCRFHERRRAAPFHGPRHAGYEYRFFREADCL